MSLKTGFIGFIAFTPTGTAAAYYGVIPCLFNINGEAMLAAQSADTMTHPDHRKKGLFALLAHRTYELAREQNIQFVFGFPNQNSLPGFIRLNWQFLPHQMQVFALKAGRFSYWRLLNPIHPFRALYNNRVRRLLGDERISVSFFRETSFDGVRHDSIFVSYKTYNDTHIATVNEVKVWVKVDGKLKIGSVQGLNRVNLEDFLNRLKKLTSRLGCDEVIFITSKNSSLYQVLCQSLKPMDAFPVGFYSLQERPITFENVSFDYCDIDIF